MREWLGETHGAGFELFRHFLVRFFDSDLVTLSLIHILSPWKSPLKT